MNPTTTSANPKKKILVVDDNEQLRTLMIELMTRAGYEVSGAENGLVALDLIETKQPDLVISDIQMPEMDGVQMGLTLRERQIMTPILFVSSALEDESHRDQIAAITPHRLPKPIHPRSLSEAVLSIFGRAA